MIKYLLTKIGRAGWENIWLLVMVKLVGVQLFVLKL